MSELVGPDGKPVLKEEDGPRLTIGIKASTLAPQLPSGVVFKIEGGDEYFANADTAEQIGLDLIRNATAIKLNFAAYQQRVAQETMDKAGYKA